MPTTTEHNLALRAILENRALTLLHEALTQDASHQSETFTAVAAYAHRYFLYHHLSPKSIATHYEAFLSAYAHDAKQFAATGKYPIALASHERAPSTVVYNTALLMSTLLSMPRLRVADLLRTKVMEGQRGLFLGAGSGIEVDLTKAAIAMPAIYDRAPDPFLPYAFPEAAFPIAPFESTESFDRIFAIEILEHVPDYRAFLRSCRGLLSAHGKLYLTTATNIPQFDHLHNFPDDHSGFEEELEQMGYLIEYVEDIPHRPFMMKIGSKNRFYVLTAPLRRNSFYWAARFSRICLRRSFATSLLSRR